MPEEIGTIFTTGEADQSYGSVISSVQINTSQILTLIQQSTDLLMFKIIKGQLYILGDNRAVLYPSGGSIDSSEVFAVYSASKVNELLSLGGSGTTVIEERSQVTTLTNDRYTLEVSNWCPPFCNQQ